MATTGAVTQNRSLTLTAIGLAAATVIAFVVLAALDHDGAGWWIFPVLGLAAALTAWRAGGTSRTNLGAFVALIVGVVAILVFVGWIIADAA
jgi:hypothetical protein